jgi:hypothetical protein
MHQTQNHFAGDKYFKNQKHLYMFVQSIAKLNFNKPK